MTSQKLSALTFKEKAPGYHVYGIDGTPARGRFHMVPSLNAQTGLSYTLQITDSYDIVTMANAAANTVTIPTNASVAFPVGVVIDIVEQGAGATTIQGDTGVTLNGVSAGSVVITSQYGILRLLKIATDEWIAELATFSIAKATASDIRAGTSDKYLTADGVESAAEEVTLTDAATVAVDWSAFINASVTLGGNRTLGNPTNGEPGTWRFIRVIQDGTGSRTLAFGANYKFPGGTAPTLTTTAGAVDALQIYCVGASEFYVFSALDMS